MTFFTLSDGTSAATGKTDFELGGGEPIPDNTKLLAIIDEAKWSDYEGAWHIALRWTVLQPAEYKNRKVFQKLHVNDPAKADKAKRMLAAIDANCGGVLAAANANPTDQSLTAALTNKPMVICVKVWDMNGNKGNWICAVSARKQGAAPAPAPVATQSHAIDDEVPF
jgi:hypothetical protein